MSTKVATPNLKAYRAHSKSARRKKPVRKNSGFHHRQDGRCEAPGCGKIVLGGRVRVGQQHYFCGDKCRSHFYATRYRIGTCAHCGGVVTGSQRSGRNRKIHFCSKEHEALYHDDRLFGPTEPFRSLIREYLALAPNYRPTTLQDVRLSLAHFFSFVVQDEKITDLEAIGPAVISRYIAREKAKGRTSFNFVGHLSTFFSWLYAEERMKRSNPVVPRIHSQKSSPTRPRPYSEEEITEFWSVLESQKNTALALALAIGLECGMRAGEVANIRLQDVDKAKQQILIRLPTKNMRTRIVPYHEKVEEYLSAWLKERNSGSPHDHLLHGERNAFWSRGELQRRMREFFKAELGNQPPFIFHRLRHTWATRLMNNGMELAVLKELGGWVNWNSVQKYIQVLPRTIRQQYEQSYAKLQRRGQEAEPEAISLLDFVNERDSEQ